MEISEVTSEGAIILFTRYDLEVFHNVLKLIAHEADPERFEAAAGSSLLDVQRMLEKIETTYKRVVEN